MRQWWMDAWETLCSKRYAPPGYSALSKDERLWFNIRALIDLTSNGGLISYFYNSEADTLDDCLVALDRLGAFEVRFEVERVAALFGENVPPTIDARNDVINSWPDDPRREALLNEVDNKLYGQFDVLEAKLEDFVRSFATGYRQPM